MHQGVPACPALPDGGGHHTGGRDGWKEGLGWGEIMYVGADAVFQAKC